MLIESKKACRLPALVSAAPASITRHAAKADYYALATRSVTFQSCVFAVGGLPDQPSAWRIPRWKSARLWLEDRSGRPPRHALQPGFRQVAALLNQVCPSPV
jgi:hypothetical protein